MSSRCCRRVVVAAATSWLLAARSASAAPDAGATPSPTPERIRSAAEEFDRGRRAYLAKDFEQAAVHFENAYRDAPRAEALRLAIRARREAKQLARAATHAAAALERYPDDGPTTQLAKEVLAEATPALHDLTVQCAAACTLTEGGRVLVEAEATRHRLFLDPGLHAIGVGFVNGAGRVEVDAKRGGRDVLSVTPEVEAPPPPPPKPKPEPVRPAPPPPSGKPLGPVVFFVAAGVTLALGGATVASGLDARANPGTEAVRAACAGKDETCPLYQEGQRAELRTNILLGATAGTLVLTGVVGLFFTRWSSSTRALVPSASMTASGASAGLSGRF